MTPRRKQLIPSSTQKSADDELNTRETGMEIPCWILYRSAYSSRHILRKSRAAPLRLGDRYKDDRVSAACLAGGWSLILIPVYISHKPDQNQMTIVFCRLWSATLRRITRAVPLSSLPRRIIPTCPSASLLHSRQRLDWRHLVCWPRNFQNVRRGTAG